MTVVDVPRERWNMDDSIRHVRAGPRGVEGGRGKRTAGASNRYRRNLRAPTRRQGRPLRRARSRIGEAVSLARGKSRPDLDCDRLLQLALTRLRRDRRRGSKQGTRNRLIRGYDFVDLNILWEIVATDSPGSRCAHRAGGQGRRRLNAGALYQFVPTPRPLGGSRDL